MMDLQPLLLIALSVCTLLQVTSGQCVPPDCACGLEQSRVQEIEASIADDAAYMLAIPNMRCTLAGLSKFQECNIAVKQELFSPKDISSTWNNFAATSDPTWKYMNCKYPVSEGGMTMHSYVFVGGQLKGDGFDTMSSDCSDLKTSMRLLGEQQVL